MIAEKYELYLVNQYILKCLVRLSQVWVASENRRYIERQLLPRLYQKRIKLISQITIKLNTIYRGKNTK